MKRRITVAIVACVAALGVASCGDDEEETTTTTTEPTTTTTDAVTGATGAEGADEDTDEAGGTGEDPEGTGAVQDLLEQTFVAQGLTKGESECVAELVAPEVAGEDINDVQDPSYVEDLLKGIESEIEECEGQ